ncbi:MAG: Rpp14/Pop5 family protein [Candidatus Bathyarchaeia archaeon]|nr:Rpp14/Pop5 family protein [Candidatus Bathyarchaeota archaeon]
MRDKVRRRYFALKIDSNEKISQKEFMDAVWETILRLYGEYGASKMGLTLINYDADKGLAIIRATHTEIDKFRAAIAFITGMAAKPAAVRIITVSGTLKALHKKIGIKTH